MADLREVRRVAIVPAYDEEECVGGVIDELRAFDDGVRVFIEFPESIAQGELPPLFVIGAKGEAELVNYRVSGRYMIVDRLFAKAELRLGGRKGQQTVRIVSNRRGRA